MKDYNIPYGRVKNAPDIKIKNLINCKSIYKTWLRDVIQ